MPDSLLEREGQLLELSDALAAAAQGTGSVVILEAHEGTGKTAMVEAACERARDRGMGILTARGSEFGRTYPWGVVRSLFAPVLALPEAEREHVFTGAAALADGPLGLEGPAGHRARDADALGAALHGLYWALANLALSEPRLVGVDDAHWADVASLRWLEYLAGAIADLPVLLCVAVDPSYAVHDRGLLLSLAAQATTLTLSPLSVAATTDLVRQRVGNGADERLGAACHTDTSGNPFLLQALLDELCELDAGEIDCDGLDHLASEAISRALDRRLARLPPMARQLAASLAIWGGTARLRQVATLAGIDDEDAAGHAADALLAGEIVRPGEPLEFVAPIVGQAVHGSIPPHERSNWHARAAELLDDAGAPIEKIASHLLAVEPGGDALLVDVLCDAADRALATGAPETAAAYLERALNEPPADSQRARVLRLLGRAEVSQHRPGAEKHLEAALAAAADVRDRVEIARELAVPMLHRGHVQEAVALLRRSADELGDRDRDLSLELEADLVNAGRVHAELRPAALARLRRLCHAGLTGRTFGERLALAAIAGEADAVAATADEAIACALKALSDGRLLSEVGAESPSYWYAVSGLILTDACEPAEPAVEAALVHARTKGSKLGSALAHCFRSLLRYRTGDLREAEADARYAIEIAPGNRWAARTYALAFLIDVLIDRGRTAEAADVLAENGTPETAPPLLPYLVLRQNRGRLRIALGDLQAGEADMRAAAQELASRSFGPCVWPWRSFQALELARREEKAEALELAREEAALAETFGAPRARGISLRALGTIENGGRGVVSLRAAVRVLAGSPAVLEHARALLELGSMLRREGQRVEALAALRQGVDLAHECGAAGLTATGRAEMVMAGARPRRDAGHGRDSLTAAELRVAQMAADGMTNREIAQALFVAVRTVETHLTHAYRKLDIDSRDRLQAELR